VFTTTLRIEESLRKRIARLAGALNQTPPAPRVPNEVIARTAAKYREALERLTV
jgi:phosphoribosylaminoimidazole-succinocarboxamide synthase